MITTHDGLKLYTKEWLPPQYSALIILIHGFGEHINRYNHVAAYFNEQGFGMVGMDNRGHGQSEGKRAHTPNFEAYMQDIDIFVRETRQKFTEMPIFLYGHSMGGNLVLNYMIRRKPDLAGVVITSPLVQTGFKPTPFIVFMAKMMCKIMPTFTQKTDLVREYLSKDTKVVEENRHDPLCFEYMSASAGIGILEAADFLHNYNGILHLPTLIMHAQEDFMTSQPASETFANRVKGNITYKVWEGMYHEIHNEFEKEKVFDYTLQWLKKILNTH